MPTKKKNDNKSTWRNWLIKKLLINQTSKDDVLEIINDASIDEEINSNQNFDEINEKNLIKNILNLSEKSVEDIMVPRAEIISIEKNQTIKEIMSVIEIESHSRMPVYEKNLDTILGFFHIKDFVTAPLER